MKQFFTYAAVLALSGFAATSAAACTLASGELGKVLCAEPALQSAWEEIHSQVDVLAQGAEEDTRKLLTEDQALFEAQMQTLWQDALALHERGEAVGVLELGLRERLQAVARYDLTPARDPRGTWLSTRGEVTVTETRAGPLEISVAVFDPVLGTRTCTIEGASNMPGDVLDFPLESGQSASLMQLKGTGPMLVDIAHSNGRSVARPIACAEGQPMGGYFFRVRDSN